MAAPPANAGNGNTSTPDPANVLDEAVSKAPAGTVLPPRTIREIIEKTAGYVARNGITFEDKLRQTQSSNAKMSFLLPDDAYTAYYRWRLSEIKAGRGNAISAGRENEPQTGVSGKGREERKGPEKPEDFQFSARMPNISAQDLEVVKLTALFVAKNGRSWMTALSQREAGNFQFDFLRPQHSLYQFFSRLVDQYTDLLTGDSVDEGRPQKRRMTELQRNVDNRFHVLDRAKKRGEWVKYQAAQKVAKEEQEEKERVAYAEVDWHDFVVVETVVFDERDEAADLPAPTTLNDLQSASLEQKAAMSIAPNRRIEEAMPTFDDYNQFYGAQQPQQPAPQQPSYAPTAQPTSPPQAAPYQPPAPPDAASRASALQADRDRARQAQLAARNPAAPKIRQDYTPRALQQNNNTSTSICPNCGQAIPNTDIENHMRIEMLDPQWRDQNRIAQQRSSTTNLSTADVARNLKRLASQRGDVFDPVTGREVAASQEEEARQKRKLEGGNAEAAGPAGSAGGERMDVQEQIRQLHQKYKS